MDFRDKHKRVFLNFVEIILSYIAVAALGLVVLDGKRTPIWHLFIDHYIKFPVLVFVFAAASGGLLYFRPGRILLFLKTGAFRYGIMLTTVVAGLFFKLPAPEVIISLYVFSGILYFSSSSLENEQLPRTITGQILAAIYESRATALFALLLLLCSQLFVILKKTSIADSIGHVIYYLLVITVILRIREIKYGTDNEKVSFAALMKLFKAVRDSISGAKAYLCAFSLGKVQLICRAAKHAGRSFTIYRFFYFVGIIVLLLLISVAQSSYYKENILRNVSGNADYRSEISLRSNKAEYALTADADDIYIPIRIKHPLSKPILWDTNGPDSVRIGILWFSENSPAPLSENIFEDQQPLPKALYVKDSVDAELKLKRPPFWDGKTYEVWIGLVSGKNLWFMSKGDKVLKVRVSMERPSEQPSVARYVAVYSKLFDRLQDKLEDHWSYDLSHSSKDNYRSKIEVLKDNISTKFNVLKISVTNMGKIPWPSHSQNPVMAGVIWVKKVKENGKIHYLFLSEQKYPLPDVVYPNEQKTIEVLCDPLIVPDADEMWIGMVHDGKTWFYEKGDEILKLNKSGDRNNLIADELNRARQKYNQLTGELGKSVVVETRLSQKKPEIAQLADDAYRSRIWLLNYGNTEVLRPDSNGSLHLELEVTNSGKMTWNTSEPFPVTLGVRWFNASGEKTYSAEAGEERCKFPSSTVFANATFKMQCDIAKNLPRGNYEVWIGPVQEGVTWFYEKGDSVLKLNVKVR